MQRIAVIDYGMGNLRSVSKALEHVAPKDEVLVSSDESIIASADRIVCPGQGAAADCMLALHETGLARTIADTISTRPFLGICMGYQVLFTHSEENEGVDCLDMIRGSVNRFAEPLIDSDNQRLKVPHMGWSKVKQVREHPLWQGIADDARFYFAHSYFCVPDNAEDMVASTEYGQKIAVAIARDELFACQFHPEKSAADGLKLLGNFVNWNGR